MVPEGLYKRRRKHNNTPKPLLLIFANFIIVLVGSSLFTSCTKINWFFWVIIAALAVYNFFTIRRYRDEYNKVNTISYIVSIIILIGLFIIFRVTGQGC